jgi:murein DD-endopeptidase MepM/ murein hydrolase activator NlpD
MAVSIRTSIRLFASSALLLSFLTFCTKPVSKSGSDSTISKPSLPNPFNLDVKEMILCRDTIEANQTLSDILLPHNVSRQRINEIEKAASNIFPVRNFRTDDEVYIYSRQDSLESVKYLIYVQDPVNYVLFDLKDTIKIYKKQKPVTLKQVIVSGTINSSLYQTFQEKNIDLKLAYKLADIYECEIDFFHIQQNDSFKVYYEQIYLEDKPVSVGKILAADFYYHKENYLAFFFDKEKEGNYFDDKGNSLRKGFLKAPLKFNARITSFYSKNRFHPILHINKAHLGTDFAAPTGTPIISTANGVVLEAAYTGGNGNYVKVKHNATYTTQYLHMSRFAAGIHRGTSVKQGQIIGYVGSTGLATGPHVCYRFWKNGRQVDPRKEKNIALNPVSKKNKPAFEETKKNLLSKLSPDNDKSSGPGSSPNGGGTISTKTNVSSK